MNTFKRKALFTAMVAAVGTAGTAEAAFLCQNGTGRALVYPYYCEGASIHAVGSSARVLTSPAVDATSGFAG